MKEVIHEDRKAKLPQSAPFLTHIPYRTPEVKLHLTEGLARAAVQAKTWGGKTQCPMDVYRFNAETGMWVCIWEIPYGLPKDQLPWKKDSK